MGIERVMIKITHKIHSTELAKNTQHQHQKGKITPKQKQKANEMEAVHNISFLDFFHAVH